MLKISGLEYYLMMPSMVFQPIPQFYNFNHFQTCSSDAYQNQSSNSHSPVLSLNSKQNPLQAKVTLIQELEVPNQRQNQKNPPILASQQKRKSETDYRPYERKIKKNVKNSLNQYRNIVPNTINQIQSFVQRKNKSGLIVKKILAKYAQKSSYTMDQFYAYQAYIKDILSSQCSNLNKFFQMINFQSYNTVFSIQEQVFFNKVARICIKHYLNHIANEIALTSKRMKKDNKRQHLKVNRQLLEKLSHAHDIAA